MYDDEEHVAGEMYYVEFAFRKGTPAPFYVNGDQSGFLSAMSPVVVLKRLRRAPGKKLMLVVLSCAGKVVVYAEDVKN